MKILHTPKETGIALFLQLLCLTRVRPPEFERISFSPLLKPLSERYPLHKHIFYTEFFVDNLADCTMRKVTDFIYYLSYDMWVTSHICGSPAIYVGHQPYMWVTSHICGSPAIYTSSMVFSFMAGFHAPNTPLLQVCRCAMQLQTVSYKEEDIPQTDSSS